MRHLRALAFVLALGAASAATAQTTTGGAAGTDVLAGFGPLLAIILVFIWAQWGGFRWILPG